MHLNFIRRKLDDNINEDVKRKVLRFENAVFI